MCTPKAPKAPKVTPLPPPASSEVIDPAVLDERNRERNRQRTAGGRQSTILASRAQGYLPPTGQAKTAMGS
jgi:hypothetical protein